LISLSSSSRTPKQKERRRKERRGEEKRRELTGKFLVKVFETLLSLFRNRNEGKDTRCGRRGLRVVMRWRRKWGRRRRRGESD